MRVEVAHRVVAKLSDIITLCYRKFYSSLLLSPSPDDDRASSYGCHLQFAEGFFPTRRTFRIFQRSLLLDYRIHKIGVSQSRYKKLWLMSPMGCCVYTKCRDLIRNLEPTFNPKRENVPDRDRNLLQKHWYLESRPKGLSSRIWELGRSKRQWTPLPPIIARSP